MLTAHEVGIQKPLLHIELAALALGKVDDLMADHRVCLVHVVVVEVEAHTLRDIDYVGEHLRDLFRGNALALTQVVSGRAVEIHGGIWRKLEGVVLDLDLTAELLGAGLELALADVAPRALYV